MSLVRVNLLTMVLRMLLEVELLDASDLTMTQGATNADESQVPKYCQRQFF